MAGSPAVVCVPDVGDRVKVRVCLRTCVVDGALQRQCEEHGCKWASLHDSPVADQDGRAPAESHQAVVAVEGLDEWADIVEVAYNAEDPFAVDFPKGVLDVELDDVLTLCGAKTSRVIDVVSAIARHAILPLAV